MWNSETVNSTLQPKTEWSCRESKPDFARWCQILVALCSTSRKFWAEAVFNATCIKNRVPTKAFEKKVPYEAFWGRKPPAGYLRIFGCDAYALIPQVNRKKLDSRRKKVTFLGYDLRSKAYRL